jgi:hypothetical protein
MALSAGIWQPPAGAVRNAELDAWEVSEHDAAGVRNGDATLYRDDGSVLLRCRYESGKRSGPFTSYHPNGELESEGRYVDGALDGTFRRFKSDNPGSTPLRNCCVPPGARELRVHYRRGTAFGDAFFDGQGRALRSDGTLLPERPASVPEDATFEEGDERWVQRSGSDHGVLERKSFDLDGHPVDQTRIVGGRRVSFGEFSRAGVVVREHHFDDGGELHGACLLRYSAEDTPYADAAIREVRGAYEHGQAVGAWRYLDAQGRELRTSSRGEALSDERLVALLRDDGSSESAAALREQAERLASDGRLREALFVAARAAARAGSADELRELLATVVVELEPAAAAARAAAFDREATPTVRGALDALLAGADPAELFRCLSTLVPSVRPAARELVEAAWLLDPKSSRTRVARALVCLEQGNDESALADAGALGPELDEAASQLRELARILYPKFSFVPALEPPPEPSEELVPVAVEQPLAAVRRTVLLYATRLAVVGAAIEQRLGRRPEWLPPELMPLLEAGTVELRRFKATITDEDENGSETSEVDVNETLDVAEQSVAALMIVARADWDALCWLCWSSGLDTVALPSELVTRPEFGSAVNDSMQRCFRAHDQLRTAGLVSRSRGLASFDFEGLAIETLPPRLAEIAARQYLERRALFFWLLFPENVSPFQSDLYTV